MSNMQVYAEDSIEKDVEVNTLNLIPIRETFEKFQYEVKWNSKDKSVEIVKEENKILFVTDKTKVNIPNKVYDMFLLNGLSYTQVEYLESIGIKYNYTDNDTILIKQKTNMNYAPIIEMETLKEEDLSLLNENEKNKILFFWATWCPYCTKHIAELNQMNLESLDLEIIGVNIDDKEEDVQKFIENNELNFYNILDPDKTIFKYYNPTVIPTTYFINKENKIINIIRGSFDEEEIVKSFNL